MFRLESSTHSIKFQFQFLFQFQFQFQFKFVLHVLIIHICPCPQKINHQNVQRYIHVQTNQFLFPLYSFCSVIDTNTRTGDVDTTMSPSRRPKSSTPANISAWRSYCIRRKPLRIRKPFEVCVNLFCYFVGARIV